MNDLSKMLRDAVEDAPHDPWDVTAAIEAGRRRVRRRRTVAACLAAAVVLVVVAGLSALLGHDGHRSRPLPAHPTPVKTLRLADAPTATGGTEFTVTSDPELASGGHVGMQVVGILPDGRRIIQVRAPGGGYTTVEGIQVGSGTYLGRANGLLAINTGQTVSVYDLAAEQVTQTYPTPVNGLDGWTVADGTLFMSSVPAPGQHSSTLKSLPLRGDRLADRPPDGQVGAIASDGAHTLAYTDVENAPARRVSLLDLTTRRTTSFDPHTPAGCDADAVALTSQRAFLEVRCGPHSRLEGDVRVLVYTHTGQQVATIQGPGLTLTTTNAGAVTIESIDGGAAGAYLYTTGDRLLRLPRTASPDTPLWAVGTATDRGTRVAWPEDLGRGTSRWVTALFP